MEQLVDYLRSAIPALFEGEEYHAKAEAIRDEFSKRMNNYSRNWEKMPKNRKSPCCALQTDSPSLQPATMR